MKNVLLFTLLLLAFSKALYAQTDTIALVKRGRAKVYTMDGKTMNMRMLESTVGKSKYAKTAFRKSSSNRSATFAFSYAGGFAIGYSLGAAIGSGKLSVPLLAAGVGFIGISVPFARASNRHLKRSVELYNDEQMHRTTYRPLISDVRMCVTGNSLGLRLSF